MDEKGNIAYFHRESPVTKTRVEGVVKKHMRFNGDPANGLGFDLFVPPERPAGDKIATIAYDRLLETIFERITRIYDDLERSGTEKGGDSLVYNNQATSIILETVNRVLNS